MWMIDTSGMPDWLAKEVYERQETWEMDRAYMDYYSWSATADPWRDVVLPWVRQIIEAVEQGIPHEYAYELYPAPVSASQLAYMKKQLVLAA